MKRELDADQLDRAAGVLIASAAGDALGAGYEFSIPADGAVISMIGGGPFGFDPGEWTDDTSMRRSIAKFNLDLMRKRQSAYKISHCRQLAEAALTSSRTSSAHGR